MDPNEFLFLILPLAALVPILVVVVFHLARKEDITQHKEAEMLNELMRTGTVDKENSAALQGLVHNKLIDKDSCERLRNCLKTPSMNPRKNVPNQSPHNSHIPVRLGNVLFSVS